MPVGLISRRAASVNAARAAVVAAAPAVTVAGATADAGQDDQLTAALDALTGQLGVPGALVYNAGLPVCVGGTWRRGSVRPGPYRRALLAPVHPAPGGLG